MHLTYIDGHGQQQVALAEQVVELVRYGHIHQQTQYFDVPTQQWQFFGYMFPQLFQQVAAPPVTQVVAEVETEPLIQLQPSVIATNPINPMATAPLVRPDSNVGLPQVAQQQNNPSSQTNLSTSSSSAVMPAHQSSTAHVLSGSQRTLATGSGATLMGQTQASTSGRQSIPFPSPTPSLGTQNKTSFNSSPKDGYPTWLLVMLLVASMATMALGQFGVGYWVTLLVAITGIIVFSKLTMETGLKIAVTTLLTLLTWAVPLIGTVSDAAEESRNNIEEKKR